MVRFAGLVHSLSQVSAYVEYPLDRAVASPRIDVRQTHISVVFLFGDLAWKVKKPVDLGFLDFSTLEKRRRLCEEELRINRRTAPGVYLGIDEIVRERDGSLRVTASPGDREIVEVAVRMRRLPEDGLLDRRLDAASPDRRAIAGVELRRLLVGFAPDLAAFHAAGPTGAGIDEHGGPSGMRRQFEENLDRLDRFAGPAASDTISRPRFEWLRRQAFGRLEALRPRLEVRERAGRVRDGHGDLHAGNLCVVDGRILAFDAIEFDRRLRCRDVAAEAAHLAMDLDRRGLPGLAEVWTRAYARAAADREVHRLAMLFRFHYAVVRSLVESIRGRDELVCADERGRSRAAARRYANLATGYLLPPAVVLTCGLQGTGKSTLAREIAVPLRAVVLRSDVIRKQLAGVSIEDRRGLDRQGDDLYGAEWTRRTYDALLDAAGAALRRGRHVVIDAAFAKAWQRERFSEMANRRSVPWCVAEVTCPREEVRRRLDRRAEERTEPSDADWSVYEQAEATFERPSEIPAGRRIEWRGDGPTLEGVGMVLDRLVEESLAVAPTPGDG